MSALEHHLMLAGHDVLLSSGAHNPSAFQVNRIPDLRRVDKARERDVHRMVLANSVATRRGSGDDCSDSD